MTRIDLVMLAHQAVAARLHPGDIAIDATLGNGHDTLFLASCIGASGQVYGFDIQPQAVAAVRHKLEQESRASRVTLFECGHQQMCEKIPRQHHGLIKAVMFNLGYLPGADKLLTTLPATTLQALQCAVALLAPHGIITIIAYTGHAGGHGETEAVREWLATLDPACFTTQSTIPPRRHHSPPELLVVTSNGNSSSHLRV